jgi:hypothetical protein
MGDQRHECKALFESASQKGQSSVLEEPIHRALPRRLAGVEIWGQRESRNGGCATG